MSQSVRRIARGPAIAAALVIASQAAAAAQPATNVEPPIPPPTASAAPSTAASPTGASPTAVSLSGRVVDSASALPIPGVRVTTDGPTVLTATTDANGRFMLPRLKQGIYTLTARTSGYQAAATDPITTLDGQAATVTLTLQRFNGNTGLRTIGKTSTSTNASLEKASVLYQSVNPELATEQGYYRLGDALRQLPGVVNGGSDTASPADDLSLNFRGIGALETLTLLDGHPVGYGLATPYNFDISPGALFRNVQAVYGSGADQFYSLNAVGGIFDFQTINPTPALRASVQQQYGTFHQVGTTLAVTGTAGKIGYAGVAATTGISGPYNNLKLYNYSASQDPGALGALQQTGYTNDSSNSTTRSLLGKIVIPAGLGTRVTLTAVDEAFYDNKTGNGDQDFTPYAQAFEKAQGAATSADPAARTYGAYAYTPGGGPPQATGANVTCPAGYAPLSNGNGIPSGTYTQNTLGLKIGGVASACVTPTQYASVNSGLNGAGAAFQTYNLNDYDARIENTKNGRTFTVDAYSDRYLHHYDRDFQLPYLDVPGDNPASFFEGVSNSGITASEQFTDAHNSTGIGMYFNNAAYSFISNGSGATNSAAYNDFTAFLREAYTLPTKPLTVYGNLWVKNAGETNATYVDPRGAIVYALRNDVFRVSEGETTTQPYISALAQPFSPAGLGAFNGNVTTGTCASALTSPFAIGSGGSGKGLKAERGVDTEASYGHRFFGDSLIQATFYNTNVFNKIYSSVSPLSIAGTAGITAAQLATYDTYFRNACGQGFDVNGGLGISAATNLAHIRAQGVEISGRQRLLRQVAFDYDYATNAVQLVSAPAALLSYNGRLIPGSQLPNVPLHQYNVALNYEFARSANLRLEYHHVSDNNTKNLGPYGFANLLATSPAGPGRLAIGVINLFNNASTFYNGLENLGVPLSSNAFATGTPISTERFGLPFRTIDFTFTLQTR